MLRLRRAPARAVITALASAAVLAAAWIMAARTHGALLYPDGYQYLVMARGIAEHAHAVGDLGGWTLLPNADAASKPLFPAVVALVQVIPGVTPLAAAHVVAALATAGVAVSVAVLTARLTHSAAAVAASVVVVVASPALGYWLGFAGPDALAVALALTALILMSRGTLLASGAVMALAGCARPEFILVGLGIVAGAALSDRIPRRRLLHATAAGAAVVALVLAATRPPLAGPAGLWAAPLAVAMVAGMWAGAGRLATSARPLLVAGAVVLPLATALAVIVPGRTTGVSLLLAQEWPLWILFGIASTAALFQPAPRVHVLRALAIMAPLGAIYLLRNPDAERYLALLIPGAAVLIGLGVGALPRPRLRVAALLAAIAALAILQPGHRAAPGPDVFGPAADAVAADGRGPIITAAPDAYAALLPGRSIRPLEDGAEGLIVFDAAARAYRPGLIPRGAVAAVIPTGPGFQAPGGVVDSRPTILVWGEVVPRADDVAGETTG